MYSIKSEKIDSVITFINVVLKDIAEWDVKSLAWFRGELEEEKEPDNGYLLPKLYKYNLEDRENEMIQLFRMRAQNFDNTPDFERIDQWLFLMRHCELPTRLLDWTEGALIALFFAINRFDKKEEEKKKIEFMQKPVVWMLNPQILNLFTYKQLGFSITWVGQLAAKPCPIDNINAAWTKGKSAPHDFPVAIYPYYVHERVAAQKSCFTIHGKEKLGIDKIFNQEKLFNTFAKCDECKFMDSLRTDKYRTFSDAKEVINESYEKGKYLIKYIITVDDKNKFLNDLRSLGISHSILFPELDGLAKELHNNPLKIF